MLKSYAHRTQSYSLQQYNTDMIEIEYSYNICFIILFDVSMILALLTLSVVIWNLLSYYGMMMQIFISKFHNLYLITYHLCVSQAVV